MTIMAVSFNENICYTVSLSNSLRLLHQDSLTKCDISHQSPQLICFVMPMLSCLLFQSCHELSAHWVWPSAANSGYWTLWLHILLSKGKISGHSLSSLHVLCWCWVMQGSKWSPCRNLFAICLCNKFIWRVDTKLIIKGNNEGHVWQVS